MHGWKFDHEKFIILSRIWQNHEICIPQKILGDTVYGHTVGYSADY